MLFWTCVKRASIYGEKNHKAEQLANSERTKEYLSVVI